MRISPVFFILALAACHADPGASGQTSLGGNEAQARPPETPLRPASPEPKAAEGEWRSEKGALTYFDAASGSPVMALRCAGQVLRVSLPRVRTIPSEERMAFGGGGDVDVLVAVIGSPTVEASGPAPARERLTVLLEAGPGASYGTTAIGPLVPIPTDLAQAFSESCR